MPAKDLERTHLLPVSDFLFFSPLLAQPAPLETCRMFEILRPVHVPAEMFSVPENIADGAVHSDLCNH